MESGTTMVVCSIIKDGYTVTGQRFHLFLLQIEFSSIFSWRHAQCTLHISGEVVGGIEIQLVGDVGNSQIITLQESGDFFGCEIIDVERGIVSGCLDAAF